MFYLTGLSIRANLEWLCQFCAAIFLYFASSIINSIFLIVILILGTDIALLTMVEKVSHGAIMSILVLDNQNDRRQKISSALINTGVLLNEMQISSNEAIINALCETRIVIILDPNMTLDWHDPRLQSIYKSLIVIKHTDIQLKIDTLEMINIAALSDDEQLVQEVIKETTNASHRYIFPISADHRMQAMLSIAKKAAMCPASIMIEGESGTGKEIVAKYIHAHSHYAKGPFVAINCAAIPASMIEAVLFGYEKGAFTNAVNSYMGKFEQANHGTLFLDEIGEMSTELQSKLLRVLQEQEIERIGGKHIQKVDVRIIAATNQDLRQQMTTGKFRLDLYYRLNVINLKMLPLRMRVNDISTLAQYFVALYSQRLSQKALTISNQAMLMLSQYAWPGNVRELQNVLYRAVIMDEDNIIDLDDISGLLMLDENTEFEPVSLKSKEADAIVQVLKEANGSRSVAAKKLMISPRTLRYKISKLKAIGLEVP